MTLQDQQDLNAEAERSFDLAARLCGRCASYHGTRGYLRATGHRAGVSLDAPVMIETIAALAARRILIAGSADSGQFALVAAATAPDCRIVVADQCDTPLELVRQRAARLGRPVETTKTDLTERVPGGSFDLILAHSILPFIPDHRRRAFLGNLARVLAPGGHLLLVNHERKGHKHVRTPEETLAWIDTVVAVMEKKRIPCPSDRPRFIAELNRFAASEGLAWEGQRHLDTRQVETLLNAVGLTVLREWDSPGRDNIGGVEAGAPKRLGTTYLLATPTT